VNVRAVVSVVFAVVLWLLASPVVASAQASWPTERKAPVATSSPAKKRKVVAKTTRQNTSPAERHVITNHDATLRALSAIIARQTLAIEALAAARGGRASSRSGRIACPWSVVVYGGRAIHSRRVLGSVSSCSNGRLGATPGCDRALIDGRRRVLDDLHQVKPCRGQLFCSRTPVWCRLRTGPPSGPGVKQ
jgi:hypothetical protein